jgi:hypothetical protein
MKIPLLQKLSAKEQRLVYIILGLGGLWLIYSYLIEPAFSKLTELDETIKQCKELKASDDIIRERKEFIIKDYETYQSYMTPPEETAKENSKLAELINGLAQKSQVTINNLATKEAKECRVVLDCEGKITSIIQFIYDLSCAPVLLKIEKVDLSLKAPKDEPIKCMLTISRPKLF